MSTYSSVADLATRMRIEPLELLERLREAGVDKSDVCEPVYEADVAALSALYRQVLGPRAAEIVAEVRAEAGSLEPTTTKGKASRLLSLSADEFMLVPFDSVRTSYQRRALEILGGIEVGDAFALKVVRGSIPDSYVASLRHHGEHLRRVIALARHRIATAAGDIVACRLSEREVAVHPAFAPPRAVI